VPRTHCAIEDALLRKGQPQGFIWKNVKRQHGQRHGGSTSGGLGKKMCSGNRETRRLCASPVGFGLQPNRGQRSFKYKGELLIRGSSYQGDRNWVGRGKEKKRDQVGKGVPFPSVSLRVHLFLVPMRERGKFERSTAKKSGKEITFLGGSTI